MSITATSRTVWIAPPVFLAVALGDWPYGYYQVVRFVVCSACAYFAYVEYQDNRAVNLWVFALGATAVLFNPIAQVHLRRARAAAPAWAAGSRGCFEGRASRIALPAKARPV